MKRILFSLVCISLIPAVFAKADISDKNAKLLQAAKDDNLSAVKTALSESTAPNAKDEGGLPVNWIGYLSNVLVAAATVAVAVSTYFVRKATQLQFVASMTSAFQNEWHYPRAVLMRDYLHSTDFENVLNEAIKLGYTIKISYKEICQLLDRSELKGSYIDSERLKKFEDYLKDAKYTDPLDPSKSLFSAYQAVYEVLLSFDRLAVVRDDPFMMEKCIIRYKPPIRDLSSVLQAFIAVRILLRPKHLRNYKKDYMHLLALLDLENPDLFEKCKQGLIDPDRKELSGKELKDWKAIQKRHAQRHG